jgi:hypothetical protein
LFGVQASGNTFVYVLDRSASMKNLQNRPINAAKAELLASLAQLGSLHRFQIIFYNEDPMTFAPVAGLPATLQFASPENKLLAAKFIAQIMPQGSTRHFAALEMAIRMTPDAVYLLTDAAEPMLTASELRTIERRNRGTAIHAIEFGSGPDLGDDNFLRQLARQNNGQHLYVDITALPSN